MKNEIVKLYRSFIQVFCFSLFCIGALFVRYLVFNLQRVFIKDKIIAEKYYSSTLQKYWQFFIRLITFLKLIKINFKDEEKIKNIKNSVIVATHPSLADIVILISIIPQSTCFVAEKLTRNPFFKGMVDLLFIADDKEFKWIEKTKNKFENGFNVIIFPTGTRHKKNEYLKVRRGAALIANRFEKNIHMLKIETSFDFLSSHQPFYDAGVETVVYDISYFDEINTNEYLKEYPDEISFKTAVTKQIKETLYCGKK